MPFVVAIAIAVVLTPAAAWVGRRASIVDRPSGDGLKIHSDPVPLLGGVAVVVAAFVSEAVTGHIRWFAWAAVAVAMCVGLVDDTRPVRPLPRLTFQVVSGAILAVGVLLETVEVGPRELSVAAAALVLVPVCANAVNVTDGQDGLAGGVGAIAALGLSWLSVEVGSDEGRVAGLALAGGLGGFLVWNRPPARVYLGNGGAYALGTLLAGQATEVLLQTGWRGLVPVGTCLAFFAFELAFTVLRRMVSGRAVLEGDRLHSYDLLAEEVGSRGRATAIVLICAAACAVLARIGETASVLAMTVVVAITVATAAWAGIHFWGLATQRAQQQTQR